MTTTSQTSPESILRILHGSWATMVLSTAIRHTVFDHLNDFTTADELASAAKISGRGAQALLDGLLGNDLVELEAGRYRNTPSTRQFLVSTSPDYLGDFSAFHFVPGYYDNWQRLPNAVKTGAPVVDRSSTAKEEEFFEQKVGAIAAVSSPIGRKVAVDLKIEGGAPKILDLGGGSGIVSIRMLEATPAATAVQVDLAEVNKIARKYAERSNVSDRFATQDANFFDVDLPKDEYDVAIYSNIGHMLGPDENIEMLRKLRHTLKPEGTLVISDLILNPDRTGRHSALMFGCSMLLYTPKGDAWTSADYIDWAGKAGFSKSELTPTQMPFSLMYFRA